MVEKIFIKGISNAHKKSGLYDWSFDNDECGSEPGIIIIEQRQF
jgi:hypothetical protein